MRNIWWPTFGNAERSLFVSLSLSRSICLSLHKVSTPYQSWSTSYVIAVSTHCLRYQLGPEGHQILHISGAGIISGSPYIPH
jgi:hypothetical protein